MEQISLDLGRARGDQGIARAADKADRLAPDWIEAALRELRYFARNACTKVAPNFTMEEARQFVEAIKPKPDEIDARVWGAITREAIRRGYVERIPGVYRAAASSNGAVKACYRAGARA